MASSLDWSLDCLGHSGSEKPGSVLARASAPWIISLAALRSVDFHSSEKWTLFAPKRNHFAGSRHPVFTAKADSNFAGSQGRQSRQLPARVSAPVGSESKVATNTEGTKSLAVIFLLLMTSGAVPHPVAPKGFPMG